MTKLNLGAGNDYREGYINVDNGMLSPLVKPDINCNIKDYQFADNSLDEILLSHVVMYLRPEELAPLLYRWHSWLKVGGQLIIETINIEKVCSIIANSTDEEEIHDKGLVNLFGRSDTGPHAWGWYPHSLTILLAKAGFQQIYQEAGDKKPERDFKLLATK